MAKAKQEVVLIPVIEEFLAKWKEQARKYYTELRARYVAERDKEYDITEENLKAIPKNSWEPHKQRYTDEKIQEILAKLNAGELPRFMVDNLKGEIRYAKFNRWKAMHTQAEMSICENMWDADYLEKVLDKEVESKRAKLFATVEKKAGKIVDASGLHIGVDGGINGIVIGEEAKVKVQTIYAGGWNIQCLHYRVLVKAVK